MDITEEILLNNGFVLKNDSFLEWKEYSKYVNDKWSLTVMKVSNYFGRNWTIHVDNQCMDTVGVCDIQTVEHFNDFMRLLDIDFQVQ